MLVPCKHKPTSGFGHKLKRPLVEIFRSGSGEARQSSFCTVIWRWLLWHLSSPRSLFLVLLVLADCSRLWCWCCWGTATSRTQQQGRPRSCAVLLPGDSYSKQRSRCLSWGPGLHQFVQFMLGGGSKMRCLQELTACTPI